MLNDGQFRKMMEMMNRHVPSKRVPLSDLLGAADAGYTSKDGMTYCIKRDELKLIASLLDPGERQRLKLPIIIMTDTSYDGGAWKVMGRLEVKVISQIADRTPEKPEEMRLYHAHMQTVRRKLPTATTTFFSP